MSAKMLLLIITLIQKEFWTRSSQLKKLCHNRMNGYLKYRNLVKIWCLYRRIHWTVKTRLTHIWKTSVKMFSICRAGLSSYKKTLSALKTMISTPKTQISKKRRKTFKIWIILLVLWRLRTRNLWVCLRVWWGMWWRSRNYKCWLSWKSW